MQAQGKLLPFAKKNTTQPLRSGKNVQQYVSSLIRDADHLGSGGVNSRMAASYGISPTVTRGKDELV